MEDIKEAETKEENQIKVYEIKMIEIECIRCHTKFNVGKEKIDDIKKLQLEEMGPEDLLDFFPLIGGRCKKEGFETKKHAFSFTEDFNTWIRNKITDYDHLIDENKNMLVDVEVAKSEIKDKEKEIEDAEKLIEDTRKKIEELRGDISNCVSDISNYTEIKIPEHGQKILDILKEFDNLGLKLELWR